MIKDTVFKTKTAKINTIVITKTAENSYSRNSLNGHSRKRTALLTAALFETPYPIQTPYKLCIFTFS